MMFKRVANWLFPAPPPVVTDTEYKLFHRILICFNDRVSIDFEEQVDTPEDASSIKILVTDISDKTTGWVSFMYGNRLLSVNRANVKYVEFFVEKRAVSQRGK